jgi:hypothetical protein
MKFQSIKKTMISLLIIAILPYPAFSQESRPDTQVPFIYYGHVFLADAEAMGIRRIGSLSVTAPPRSPWTRKEAFGAVKTKNSGEPWIRLQAG